MTGSSFVGAAYTASLAKTAKTYHGCFSVLFGGKKF